VAIGFVVALALTFRSSTAYERYIDGIKYALVRQLANRRYWQQLLMTTRMFARVLWVHAKERPGEDAKDDILAKLFAPDVLPDVEPPSTCHLDL
jgi:ion channel-forming bestrophin family protein